MSDLYNQTMNFIVSKPCPKCGKHFLSYDMPHSLLYFCKCSNCDFTDDRKYIEILPVKLSYCQYRKYIACN